jgi:hypothetical protein
VKNCLHHYSHDERGMIRGVYGQWYDAAQVDENIKALLEERRALKREIKEQRRLYAALYDEYQRVNPGTLTIVDSREKP